MSSSNKRTKQARPLYAENRRKQIRLKKEGGVSKSMLALNESIIDIKEH